PPYMRAVLATSEGRLPEALSFYARALSEDRHAVPEIHLARGRIFFALGNNDSARAEIALGLDSLRVRDSSDFVYLYESKGILEHGLGVIFENQGRVDDAREAYGRALQEDLSYYPAHVRLGMLAVSTGDSTTALSEMALAVQIKEDDPWV